MEGEECSEANAPLASAWVVVMEQGATICFAESDVTTSFSGDGTKD
jgi:hypothetical protein